MRSGNTARIYATDGHGDNPIHGAVNFGQGNSDWSPFTWRADGLAQRHNNEQELQWDLITKIEDNSTQDLLAEIKRLKERNSRMAKAWSQEIPTP